MHRVLDQFEALFSFDLPIKACNNSLNLESQSLFRYRSYLLAFLVLQFLCCLILFILNNWHYLVLCYDKNNTTEFKRTQSVVDFIKKTEYESNKLNYLENFIKRQKFDEQNTELQKLKSINDSNKLDLTQNNLNLNEISDSEPDKSSSYLYVPFFRNSRLSRTMSDISTAL